MIKYLKIIGNKAKQASKDKISTKKKNKILLKFSKLIKINQNKILKENKKDIKYAQTIGLKKNFIERLELDQNKINKIVKSVKDIIKLKDPVDISLKNWKRPNGLKIKRVTIPLGVIGVIYESRPNVTCDISSLCFKAGNSVILRGGSEAYFSNKILSDLFRLSLRSNNINQDYVQFINSRNRKVVDIMLSKMSKFFDVIIPRGGKNLVKKVQTYSTVPTIGHLEGICHTYIDKYANLDMAKSIIKNAKLRNTSICGATETILIHEKSLKKFVNPVLEELKLNNCIIYADKKIKKIFKYKCRDATNKSWSTEYLSSKVSVKSVKNVQEAVLHINKYGTMHTDAIISSNKKNVKFFIKNIKSSIAMHNTSTQFADGGEFGFGGEVGISTNKLPPRGPVGLEQLVTYKYEITGSGQIRE